MYKSLGSAYEKGELVLFIGAGASISSFDKNGDTLLSSQKLSKKIAEKAGWTYSNEPLSSVYSAAKNVLGDDLNNLLIDTFKHCSPSKEYTVLSKYSWPRIYSINIDDALDKALLRNSPQNINIRHRFDKVCDRDQLYNNLDYIKLNGSVDRMDAGFIFSQDEYGIASSKVPLWYRELAEDFYRYTFLFIGTKINEPLFYHQIARYRSDTGSIERRSYVLTPNATEIEKNSLKTLNLEHLPGTLNDFTSWLQSNFPTPLCPTDIAFNKNPALKEMFSKESNEDKKRYTKLFDDIVIVNHEFLKSASGLGNKSLKIRQFYRGFKPEWDDILDGVPAILEATNELYKGIRKHLKEDSNLLVVTGPAGSGKTTLLMQVALMLSEKNGVPCYFLEKPTLNFEKLIVELEKLNKSRFCVFYDKLDSQALELKNLIESNHLTNCLFIGSESQRKWENFSKEIIGHFSSLNIQISEINESDAKRILNKLERFGPWTRLGKLTKKNQINELMVRSKRQLLIGLLEVTYGIGFEKIIEKEFNEIPSGEEQLFVIVVGLATMHRYYIKQEYVSRALAELDIQHSIDYLHKKLSGIIFYNSGKLLARHPVYVRHLFDNVIAPKQLFLSLKALLMAYTVYAAPVIMHVDKNEISLFKSLINHKFLKDIFRTDRNLVFEIYETFEKFFENDGHFWLQYGLALRDAKRHESAFEKLKTALLAFPGSSHIEHALAQQELIIAGLSQSKIKAYDLLNSAKERLEKQISTMANRKNYPIVTLSEGHTTIVKKFDDDNEAKEIAKLYANRISSISGYRENVRLAKVWSKLTTYATTGLWENNDSLMD